MYLLNLASARGVRHNFGTLTPSPIFPKICHYFGTFTPSRIFPKICHNFGTFHEYKLWERFAFPLFWIYRMRLSLSWIHYRAHKYFKLAGRGYECLFGAADFALEKGRWYSVAKLAEWSYTTKPVAYFHMATHLVVLTLWRCPRCRPHGCSLLRPKNCKPQSITACPPFITTNITICLYTNHFGEQLSVATFGSSFREPLWIALGRRFIFEESQLSGNCFGQQLWEAALASCPEHFSGTIALKNSSFRGQFYKQLRGAAFSSNFRQQLSGAALQNSFGEPFGGIGLKSCSFGAIASDSSFW